MARNFLDVSGALDIARLIKGLKSLTSLDVSDTGICGFRIIRHNIIGNLNLQGAYSIFEAISTSITLKQINLSNNYLGGVHTDEITLKQYDFGCETIQALCKALQLSSSLINVNILGNCTYIVADKVNELKVLLNDIYESKNHPFTLCDIQVNKVSNLDSSFRITSTLDLWLIFKEICYLSTLGQHRVSGWNLAGNANLEEISFVDILRRVPPTITALSLAKNQLSQVSAGVLSEYIRSPNECFLRELDLEGNSTLLSSGTSILMSALKVNSTLRSLSLADCGIGYDGAKSIGDMLQSNEVG